MIIVPPRGAWASEVPAPSPRHPRAIPAPSPRRFLSKSTRYPLRSFSSCFAAPGALKRHVAPLCCRSSSAHVSGRLRGPFWDEFSPQKCSFVDHVSGPVGHICWGDFSLNVGYACPLKFDCFGRCEKKAHMACDPQKPIEFQDFCMCAAPPATQQGRQQRTINRIDPNKHKIT